MKKKIVIVDEDFAQKLDNNQINVWTMLTYWSKFNISSSKSRKIKTKFTHFASRHLVVTFALSSPIKASFWNKIWKTYIIYTIVALEHGCQRKFKILFKKLCLVCELHHVFILNLNQIILTIILNIIKHIIVLFTSAVTNQICLTMNR